MNAEYQTKEVCFIGVIAEDDQLVMHRRQDPEGDSQYAAIDIFRNCRNGQTVKHRDSLQAVCESHVNDGTTL